MALTPTVTMLDAVDGSIISNLVVNDGVSDVIDKNFTVPYRSSHDGLAKDVQVELTKLMQEEIDQFKGSDVIKKDAEYTAMASNIESGLVM